MPKGPSVLEGLKNNIMDLRGMSVRQLSKLCTIRKPRLDKLFDGRATPTQEEITLISDAINKSEEARSANSAVIINNNKELSDGILKHLQRTVGL